MTGLIRHPARVPFLALGMAALVAGVWAGLLRMGWSLPTTHPDLAGAHGPLMISGFLGTLISLERAAALGKRWPYIAPLLTGAGGLLIILGVPGTVGPLLITLGSLGLASVMAVIVRTQTALFSVTIGLGAVSWAAGNFLWLTGWPVSRVVFWWAGFLVLTIAGERLELARLRRLTSSSYAAFVAVTGLLLSGQALATVYADAGVRVVGFALLGLSAWLLRNDLALRTERRDRLAQFIAHCLFGGYVWLAVSGVLAVSFGGVPFGLPYDALLHALFLGFVLQMIFAHAPVIFPAVLGAPITFLPTFYAHVVLLHVSLLLRVGSDLVYSLPGREWGGLLNALALLLFLVNTAYAIRRASRSTHALR